MEEMVLEDMLIEAQKMGKAEKRPEWSYIHPATVRFKNGSETIGAITSVTFGFGLNCYIAIYKNPKGQLVLQDWNGQRFVMSIDFDDEQDDYNFDNASIWEIGI